MKHSNALLGDAAYEISTIGRSISHPLSVCLTISSYVSHQANIAGFSLFVFSYLLDYYRYSHLMSHIQL